MKHLEILEQMNSLRAKLSGGLPPTESELIRRELDRLIPEFVKQRCLETKYNAVARLEWIQDAFEMIQHAKKSYNETL